MACINDKQDLEGTGIARRDMEILSRHRVRDSIKPFYVYIARVPAVSTLKGRVFITFSSGVEMVNL